MGDLFGGGTSITSAPVEELDEEEGVAKKLRSALYATEGGALGEEIGTGGVGKRNTFFGN